MRSTLSLDCAARQWPVVVVGAGPAGSIAALELARLGVEVLLVDKAEFPRYKVCGCCLNPRGQAILSRCGLASLPRRLGAVPTTTIRLASVGGRRADLPLAGGVSLSRSALDSALVMAAVERGVQFLPGTLARLRAVDGGVRPIALKHGAATVEARASVVVAGDGLGGRLLTRDEKVEEHIAARSRIGAGAVIEHLPGSPEFLEHVIYMSCGRFGYVGLVRLEDHRLAIAAAIEPRLVKAAGGLGAAAISILEETGVGIPPAARVAKWRGVPELTRRATAAAAERVLAVGDAAGYVEPFTGEGMSWALTSGAAVAPVVAAAVQQWRPAIVQEWTRAHADMVRRRQWTCRSLSLGLRSSMLTRSVIRILAHMPGLARPVVRSLLAVP